MEEQKQKILITGATGLVGSEIVKVCQRQNIAVNYLTTSKDKIESKNGYKGFYWNPDTDEIDLDCFKDVTAIINLAGASISRRWTQSYKKEIVSSRVNSLRTLHKGIAKVGVNGIRSFVSASAIGIYPSSKTGYYTENEQGIDQSFLGDVVSLWEKEIDAFKSFNIPVAKVRIGLVLSTEGGALPEIAKPIKNYVGAAFGSGKQWQSWIHINDLARLFLFAVSNTLSGIYNGVGPNPVTNEKLTKEVAKVLGKPLFLPNIPEFMMKLLLGEMSYILFASQRVSNKKIEGEGFVFNYSNVCRCLEHLYAKEAPKKVTKTSYNNEYV